MLLTMSAGFPTDDPWADRQESISDTELDDVLRRGLLFDSVPGTRFAYSNLGYALLGRVVAVVTGRPFTEAARDTVLRPLGLDHTVFSAAEALGPVVTGFRPHDGDWEPLPMTGPGAFSSIGGLFSTVRDLARWATHLGSASSDAPEPGPVSPRTAVSCSRRCGSCRRPSSPARHAPRRTASGCSSSRTPGSANSSRTPAATRDSRRTCAGPLRPGSASSRSRTPRRRRSPPQPSRRTTSCWMQRVRRRPTGTPTRRPDRSAAPAPSRPSARRERRRLP
ncbi:beta-lactamase family protein [Curtobacterium sp. 24E2]|nr:beta-lactamase family protein [Curtobacterium sp. 24E2]